LRSLAPETKRRIKRAILALPDDPVGEQRRFDIKRLIGHADDRPIYRLRVGEWRVIYRIHESRIEIVRVFPRSEGYGWMERSGF
jgi:mRNA-degrading endonuclease RelE of RelBE toxin-antitoxin system